MDPRIPPEDRKKERIKWLVFKKQQQHKKKKKKKKLWELIGPVSIVTLI